MAQTSRKFNSPRGARPGRGLSGVAVAGFWSRIDEMVEKRGVHVLHLRKGKISGKDVLDHCRKKGYTVERPQDPEAPSDKWLGIFMISKSAATKAS